MQYFYLTPYYESDNFSDWVLPFDQFWQSIFFNLSSILIFFRSTQTIPLETRW